MTIRKVDRYVIKDGRHFETLDEAKAFVANNVCEVLSKLLVPSLDDAGIYSRSNLYKCILFLAGDYEATFHLVMALNQAFEECDTE